MSSREKIHLVVSVCLSVCLRIVSETLEFGFTYETSPKTFTLPIEGLCLCLSSVVVPTCCTLLVNLFFILLDARTVGSLCGLPPREKKKIATTV